MIRLMSFLQILQKIILTDLITIHCYIVSRFYDASVDATSKIGIVFTSPNIVGIKNHNNRNNSLVSDMNHDLKTHTLIKA